MRKIAVTWFVAVIVAILVVSGPANAQPVTDCPLRSLPFSEDSPLIDILLSDAARAVINRHSGGRFEKIPERFLGTKPPTFAAILSMKTATRFTGMKEDAISSADRELRLLPVTEADKLARCSRYDNDVPVFDLPKGKPSILLFEKINGFRDVPSVDAARAALAAMAQRKGWTLVTTEKGGAFNPKTLKKFDAVIWNNISGDVLTIAQRLAFQRYMERGGGFIAIHGSAGDYAYFWDWYVDTLIGARFSGHPVQPQYQDAQITVNAQHHLARRLPAQWTMNDEWYSFRTNPRSAGANVVLTLDESTYKPIGNMGGDLKMGDHPIAWTNCIVKGRMFYSAIGHRPETYEDAYYLTLLEDAVAWVATSRDACSTGR